jgi:hypothetical protein
MPKNRLLPILWVLLLSLGACRSRQAAEDRHPVRRYLPAEVQDLYFGMPLDAFLQQKKHLSQTPQDMSFRIVLNEGSPPKGGGLSNLVYYFDAEGDQPLYELILQYPDEVSRDAVAAKLLGSPNYQDSEWRYDSGEGYTLWAWTFNTKLVMVAILPGTEWADELAEP